MRYSELNKRNDFIAWRDLLLRVVYHSVFIFLCSFSLSRDYFVLGLIFSIPHFMTFSFFGLAGIGHELFHKSVFKNPKTNLYLFRFFSIMTWNNYSFFEYTHWKHHTITLTDDDPKSLFKGKLSFIHLVELLTFDLRGFYNKMVYTTKNAFNYIPSYLSNSVFKKGSSARKEVKRTAQFILMFHISFLVIFYFSNAMHLFVLVNLGTFFVTFFNKVLGYSQHYGLSNKNDNHKDYFENCRTVILSKYWSFFYANMNYHVEHHMFPSVPYYNLPIIHKELINEKHYPNIDHGWSQLLSRLTN